VLRDDLAAAKKDIVAKSETIEQLEEKLALLEKEVADKTAAGKKMGRQLCLKTVQASLAIRDLEEKDAGLQKCQRDMAVALRTIRNLEHQARQFQDRVADAAARYMCPVPGCGADTRVKDGMSFADASGWQSTAGHMRSSHGCWE
jgi:septal ring factor EnvC (AmiA/AmiB activator)